MSRPAPLVRHGAAGRLEGVRVALRWQGAEADAAPRLDAGPFAPGAQRIGPFEIVSAIDVGEDAVSVDATLRNAGPQTARLDAVVFGFRWSPPSTESLRFLRHGWQSWSFTGSRPLDDAGEPAFPSGSWLRGMFHALGEPPADRTGWHESDLVTVIGAASGGFALLAGVLERGRSFGVVHARRQGDGVEVEVALRVEAAMPPGARRDVERVCLALGAEASPLLEEFARILGRSADARTRQPFQAGWCSWYHFFHDVTEEDVLRNLDALVKHRDEIPIRLVQLDDGYQRAIGDWLATNPKFPRGLAPLAADIRAAGFEAGLWTAPFCVAPDSALFAAEPHWLLRHQGEPFLGLLHPMWTKTARIHVLDTSRDEVCAHLQSLFRELTAMGFRYQKLDFLYSVAMQADAFDPTVTRAERLRRGLEAVRRGCGEEGFLLGCGCPLGPAVGVVDGMRIGPDVAPSWHVADDLPVAGIEVTRPSSRNGVRSILNRAWMHRRLWLNDPDCLMSRSADTALAPHEAHTLATAIAVTGGMLLFSDDVPKLTEESRRLVAETLRVAREVDEAGEVGAARAEALLSAEIPQQVTAQVPGGVLLACVNAGEEPLATRVVPSRLAAGRPVFSVTGELGSARAQEAGDAPLEIRLRPHASELLRIRTGPPLAVFCDFDGTFLVEDVGTSLARRHAEERRADAWARFERGELTAWQYNLEVFDGFALPEETLEAFLRSVSLDPGARSLLDWCASRSVPFRILSDGYDRNVARLQELHGLRFPFDANRLRYEAGRWRIAPARPDAGCGCGTGNCKRGRIESYRRHHPGVTLVHVGNGRVSDLCGALAADVAFAKGSLAEALGRRGAPFVRFETLHDVVAHLESMAAGHAPEPR